MNNWWEQIDTEILNDLPKTKFRGYKENNIITLLLKRVDIPQEDKCILVFAETCFYAQGGGQISDKGFIVSDDIISFIVEDVRNVEGYYLHYGRLLPSARLGENQLYKLVFNNEHRLQISKLHSATHILWKLIENKVSVNFEQGFEWIEPKSSEVVMIDEKAESNLNKDTVIECIGEFNNLITNDIKSQIFYENDDINKRVVEFKDIVKEYCAGTHVDNINKIDPIKLVKYQKKGKKKHRIIIGFESEMKND